VVITNAFKTVEGILVVGRHDGTGNDIPVLNTPSWGQSSFSGQSAVIGFLKATEIENPDDATGQQTLSVNNNTLSDNTFSLYPNPTNGEIFIQSQLDIKSVSVYNIYGQVMLKTNATEAIDVSALSSALYIVEVETETGDTFQQKIFKN